VVGDQANGTFGASGTQILKGFNPTNPPSRRRDHRDLLWLGLDQHHHVGRRIT